MKKQILLLFLVINPFLFSQTDTIFVQKLDSLINYNMNLEHRMDVLEKNIGRDVLGVPTGFEKMDSAMNGSMTNALKYGVVFIVFEFLNCIGLYDYNSR